MLTETVGDRAAKARELRQAAEDLVMRKRVLRSDLADRDRALERIARLREDGRRMLAQAKDLEDGLAMGQRRLDELDTLIAAKRTELAALTRHDAVSKIDTMLRELAGLDPEALAALAAERPEVR